MSRKSLSVIAVVLAGAVLQAGSLMAKTVVVGPATCQPALVHYASIQLAVDSVQSGDTVLVCARTAPYPEQVVINKSITVKGISVFFNQSACLPMSRRPCSN